MKKLLLLFFALLTGIGGAWAEDINWNAGTGSGANFVVWTFGIQLPDQCDENKVYGLGDFTLTLRGDSNTKDVYMAICIDNGVDTGNDDSGISYPASKVIAVSNNKSTSSASSCTYSFDSSPKLYKGVTYYVMFFTDNVAIDGNYTRKKQGIKVNQATYTPTYVETTNSSVKSDYAPIFSTTLTESNEAWTLLNSTDVNHAVVNRIKITTPGTSDSYYKLSAYNLYLNTSQNDGFGNYMIISESQSLGENIYPYQILGISNNCSVKPSADNTAQTFLFDGVYLKGQTTYCLYFTSNGTPVNGTYSPKGQRIKLSKNTTEKNVYFSDAWQNWDPRYSAVLDVLPSAEALSNPMPASSIEYPIWHTLKNDKYIAYDRNSASVMMSQDNIDGEKTSDYLWAFFGDVTTGYDLYNKGTGQYLIKGSNPYSDNKGYYLTMSEKPSTKWGILLDGGKFYLKDITDKAWVNVTNGKPITYTKANAVIEAIEPNLNTQTTNYITPYVEGANDSYFNISSSSAETLNAQITTCKSDDFVSVDEYFELQKTLNSLLKRPATGLYRLQSNYTDYPDNTEKNYMNTTAPGLAAVTNTTGDGADVIIRLTDNGDGTYYIQAQGDYLQQPTVTNNIGDQVVRSTTPVAFAPIVSAPGVVGWQAGTYALHRASDNTLVGWKTAAEASQWIVEDAPTSLTLSLNAAGDGKYYATLCVPFEITLPSGTSAYTLTLDESKQWLTLSDALTTVPAGTPVVLRGDAASVTATIGTGYATTPLTTTSLKGTFTDLVVTDTDYFLGADAGKVGFYKWDGTTLKANRAYLPASAVTTEVKGFAINFDDADAIADIFRTQDTNGVYNMSGQRVGNPTHGLYIVNGKKVFIK